MDRNYYYSLSEPSAGLDPVVASEIDDLILKLRDAMGDNGCCHP